MKKSKLDEDQLMSKKSKQIKLTILIVLGLIPIGLLDYLLVVWTGSMQLAGIPIVIYCILMVVMLDNVWGDS